MTVHVTGRTWDYRDTLQQLNGWFNRAHKRWEFERLSDANIARLRATVGLIVTIHDRPPPNILERAIALADALAAIREDDKTTRTGTGAAIYGDDPTYHNHFAPSEPNAFFGFSSLPAMIDHIERIPSDQRRDGWTDGDPDWCGSADMRKAVATARHGWQDGVTAAEGMIDRLTLAHARVRRRAPAVAGGTVNVGRMLAGDPAHMKRRAKLPGRKRITFFVEAGCNALIKSETMTTRAALIGAMIDVMENAGYSASIVAVDTSLDHDQRTTYQLAVTIKEHGERLNLSDTMFALGHPSFLRRFSFALCSSVPETRQIWLDQGNPANAFTKAHPCTDNEFYVPVFTASQQRKLTDDPFSMLPMITPNGLPIKLI